MEEESRQRQTRMDKGEPYMSIQPAEDPDGRGTSTTTTTQPGYCQTKINRRLRVGLGRLLSFSSTGPVQLTLYTIGCFLSLPCRHRVKTANSAPGGEASLVIGSRKNVSEAEGNVLLFCRAN